jgi:hypothetical protein
MDYVHDAYPEIDQDETDAAAWDAFIKPLSDESCP